MAQPPPPFYFLFSHASLSHPDTSGHLGHPAIQYHYADDSPFALLPQSPDEQVIVFDVDHATVKSLSSRIAVTSLRIEEAPGAAADDDGESRNDKMHIIETTAVDDRPLDNESPYASPQELVAQYKQRNTALRNALLYSSASPTDSARPSVSPTTAIPDK